MKNEHVIYGVAGLFLGLFLGFWTANTLMPKPGAPQATGGQTQGAQSVNSGQEELPPGHPPVDPNNPVQAPPLPGSGGAQSASAEASATSMPSLLPASDGKPAEQAYKNIKVLKGVPASRIDAIMDSFTKQLGVDCTHCHVSEAEPEKDTPRKEVARKWIVNVQTTNKQMGGANQVTCYTCHRGNPRPPGQ
jgi:hypothetical protein